MLALRYLHALALALWVGGMINLVGGLALLYWEIRDAR